MTNLEKVSAVHEDDFRIYLDKLGILRDLELGDLDCNVCGNPLTIESNRCAVPVKRSGKGSL